MDNLKQGLEEAAVQAELAKEELDLSGKLADAKDKVQAAVDNKARDLKNMVEEAAVQVELAKEELDLSNKLADAKDKVQAAVDNEVKKLHKD